MGSRAFARRVAEQPQQRAFFSALNAMSGGRVVPAAGGVLIKDGQGWWWARWGSRATSPTRTRLAPSPASRRRSSPGTRASVEIGLFTEFQCPAGMTEATAFDESMAQMRAAEALGFDAVWLGELHFQKDRSVLASPLVVAGALAGCTRRVKIGIAVQVLPLSHPLRLAEDVATVDHLSRTARLRRGSKRAAWSLSGVQHSLRGKPRPVLRDPGDPPGRRGPRSASHTRVATTSSGMCASSRNPTSSPTHR